MLEQGDRSTHKQHTCRHCKEKSSWHRNKWFSVIHARIYCLLVVLDYIIFRFTNRSIHYNDEIARSFPNGAIVYEFRWDGNYSIFRAYFNYYFSLSLQSGVWNEWNTRRCCLMVRTFLNGTHAAAAMNTRTAGKSKSYAPQRKYVVFSYCDAVRSFLDTYATNDVIAEKDVNVMHFTQPSNMLQQNRPRLYGIRNLDGTKYMTNIYSKILLLGDDCNPSDTECIHTEPWMRPLQFKT